MKPFYENKDCVAQSFEATNVEFPEHLHDHVEILYVLKGKIVVQIMEKRQELKEGDCAIIFPQQIHSYHAYGENRGRLYIFEDSLVGMYLHSIRKYRPSCPFLSAEKLTGDGVLVLDRLYALSRIDCEIQPVVYPPMGKVRTMGADVQALKSTKGLTEAGVFASIDKTRLCSAWIQVLFALVWFWLAPEKKEQSESIEVTCQLIQYIMEHFQEPLTLEILARELHVNKYYLSNIFSSRLQTNFRRYLNHVRLEYAMQLMNASNAPLVDVWVEAGFNSQRSFNRAFMEIMGMTPMEYRKQTGH